MDTCCEGIETLRYIDILSTYEEPPYRNIGNGGLLVGRHADLLFMLSLHGDDNEFLQ